VRAYRQALAAVREGVGDERFILGCGALIAPSVGVFDGNRIGPDTAPFWRFLTREQRALPVPSARGPDDNLSGETSTRNVINRWWMHGRLWANDPDCLMVRDARTKLSRDEVETLASAIGLSGGMTLISDDMPLLAQDRVEMAAMFLPPLPRSAVPFDLTSSDMPERFDYVDDRAFDPVRIVGLFNFEDQARDLQLDLPAGRWNAFDLWAGEYLGVRQSGIGFSAVPPHGCRVVALRPEVRDHPTVVGTDAHIGAGLLDVAGVEWDEGQRVLTLQLAPIGRANRTIWIASASRRIESAHQDGVPVTFEDPAHGCYRIALRVEALSVLRVRFAAPGG
jgi:alpha-galactosidase